MMEIRVVAIPTEIANGVRASGKAPRYGHPAHTEIAAGFGPCRHCLHTFSVGAEKRTLFTYDAFDGVESLPLPGPVFIHAEACERYPEDAGYPALLRKYPTTFNAYAKGRRMVAQEYVADGNVSGPSSGCSRAATSITFTLATPRRDAMASGSNAPVEATGRPATLPRRPSEGEEEAKKRLTGVAHLL